MTAVPSAATITTAAHEVTINTGVFHTGDFSGAAGVSSTGGSVGVFSPLSLEMNVSRNSSIVYKPKSSKLIFLSVPLLLRTLTQITWVFKNR